jgi:UDP-GlcNAc:undecaprenyl-phosphate GlcNAc-1-phosphate transferase
MKIKQQFITTARLAKHTFVNKATSYFILNFALILFQVVYTWLRYQYINAQIPFWFTKSWGDYELAPKNYLLLIPAISFCLLLAGTLLLTINRFFIRYFTEVLYGFVLFCNIMLTYSLLKIIYSASVPFPPLISPLYIHLFIPFLAGFLAIYFILPWFIDYANKKKIVTNPQLHRHPAMILQKPSARGGGVVYAVIFVVLAFLFVGFNSRFNGLFLSVVLVALVSLIDDVQNTHATSAFKIMENPLLRLVLLLIAIVPVVISGIRIDFVNIPFSGIVDLNKHVLTVGDDTIRIVSAFITAVWIVWLMNVLSWSNGIDGQYCGIVGIASVIIAILALRFSPLENYEVQIATLAAISAGAAFGFTKYTWHPSQIMWGFGATCAGLVLSGLSISERSKIVVSILVILIPFLDALVTAVRRIIQHKSPLKGDWGHLHHLLLERGWSPKKIAVFYWLSTAALGVIGLLSPDQQVIQTTLILTGVIAFILILLNLRSLKGKTPQPQPVKASPTAV